MKKNINKKLRAIKTRSPFMSLFFSSRDNLTSSSHLVKLRNFLFRIINVVLVKHHYSVHSHHDARASRSIFCIHFSNFLINYMVKIIYFFSNLSKRKNNRRLYLRKRFCRTTLISYLTYFGEKNRIFLILKIKT